MRLFLIASSLCAAGALVAASAGLAGRPVTQSLNPPPPSFETCKAVGAGTICEGTIAESYGPIDTGVVCGSGASAFDVFDAADTNEVAKRVYDQNADLVLRVRHDRAVGRLSTAAGAALPYEQSQEWTDALAIPGDFASSTLTFTGEFVLHSPGMPVLVGAGRTVIAPDGSLDFQAGPAGFLDFIAEAPSAVNAVCSALAGS